MSREGRRDASGHGLIAWGVLQAVHCVLWLWGRYLLPADTARWLTTRIIDGGIRLLGGRRVS